MKMESERIVIREFRVEDWEMLHLLYMKPETVKYNPSGYPENELFTKILVTDWANQNSLKERKSFTFLIEDKYDHSFIGVISIELGKKGYENAEVWYKLEPIKWGVGYATEALNTILSFGFNELNLHRIESGCSIKNVASFKVMEKVGMTKEGIRRKLLPLNNEWHDGVIYSILREEFIEIYKND